MIERRPSSPVSRVSRVSRAVASASSADTNEFTDAIKSYLETNGMPSSLMRQIEARQDIPTTAVGPNPTRQAQLALVAAKRKAIMWLEEQATLAASIVESSIAKNATPEVIESEDEDYAEPNEEPMKSDELETNEKNEQDEANRRLSRDMSTPGEKNKGIKEVKSHKSPEKKSILSDLATLARNKDIPLPATISKTTYRVKRTPSGQIEINPDISPESIIRKGKNSTQPFIPRKRESLSSACRRRIFDWSKPPSKLALHSMISAGPSSAQNQKKDDIGLEENLSSSQAAFNGTIPIVTIQQTDFNNSFVDKAMEEQKRLERLKKIPSVTAMYFADRNAHLSAGCIGLSDPYSRQLVKWEKKRIMDLREKERLVPKYYTMQKAANEMVLLIKRATAQKIELEKELEARRKAKETLDAILVEILALHKRFRERLFEADRPVVSDTVPTMNTKSRRRRKASIHLERKNMSPTHGSMMLEIMEGALPEET